MTAKKTKMACWINSAILATAHVCEIKCTTINVYDSSFKFAQKILFSICNHGLVLIITLLRLINS